MKTFEKTTLIAAITAMAAFAVPSMASALTWAPLNTNKTLTSTNSAVYVAQTIPDAFSFSCSSSSLGVHVRTPASSTLDITSASFTGCFATGTPGCNGQPVTVTATGLPWAAVATSGSNVTVTEHLLAAYSSSCYGLTLNLDGNASGAFTTSTHTLGAMVVSGTQPGGMNATYMGTYLFPMTGPGTRTNWHETTNTLTLS